MNVFNVVIDVFIKLVLLELKLVLFVVMDKLIKSFKLVLYDDSSFVVNVFNVVIDVIIKLVLLVLNSN